MRLTTRDYLWLTVVAGLVLMWLADRQRAANADVQREEAIVRWHDASKKWLAATRLKAEEWSGTKHSIGGMSESMAPRPVQNLSGSESAD